MYEQLHGGYLVVSTYDDASPESKRLSEEGKPEENQSKAI